VLGACFSDFGHDVCCVDKNEQKIVSFLQGENPIFEPGLDDLVRKNVREGHLTFSPDLMVAVRTADVVFTAVDTPSRRGDGHADLSNVYQAVREIAEVMEGYTVVVTKATVPVGTGDEVERINREIRPDEDFAVVSIPNSSEKAQHLRTSRSRIASLLALRMNNLNR
jgi:UDPglucose 6-dehydrogenase